MNYVDLLELGIAGMITSIILRLISSVTLLILNSREKEYEDDLSYKFFKLKKTIMSIFSILFNNYVNRLYYIFNEYNSIC